QSLVSRWWAPIAVVFLFPHKIGVETETQLTTCKTADLLIHSSSSSSSSIHSFAPVPPKSERMAAAPAGRVLLPGTLGARFLGSGVVIQAIRAQGRFPPPRPLPLQLELD